MKARKKNSNNEWKEVKYIQLEDSDILYKQEYLEFDNTDETSESKLELYEQMGYESPLQDYWQDVRERAAIAATQGMLSNPQLVDTSYLDYRLTIEKAAVGYADELVKQLKQNTQNK